MKKAFLALSGLAMSVALTAGTPIIASAHDNDDEDGGGSTLTASFVCTTLTLGGGVGTVQVFAIYTVTVNGHTYTLPPVPGECLAPSGTFPPVPGH